MAGARALYTTDYGEGNDWDVEERLENAATGIEVVALSRKAVWCGLQT
jgi:hypothetical protein